MQFEAFSNSLGTLYSESELKSIFYFLKKEEPILWQDAVNRLAAFEPLDYIIGYTPFYKNNFKVTKDTLIPRPETEELVDWILDEQKTDNPISILDIGTGSGCIAISLVLHLKKSTVTAIDISIEALEVAKSNASKLNATVNFFHIDFLDMNHWNQIGNFDIIVSNPPYIPEKERTQMEVNVLMHEPKISLFVPDSNPLIFYEKIFEFAQSHLNPNGIIYCETSQNIQLLEYNGFKIDSKIDLSGNPRFIKGVRL
jgi:release factor glutamine methyltransferase